LSPGRYIVGTAMGEPVANVIFDPDAIHWE